MMERLNQTLFALCTIFLTSCQAHTEQANYQVVPLPQEVVLTKGDPFVLNEKTVILYAPDNALQQRNADFLAAYLKEATGKTVATAALTDHAEAHAIVLEAHNATTAKEGYALTVDAQQVRISGNSEAGVFYGIQTLRKAIPFAHNVVLPPVEIKDYPRFEYRGMHLDVARHFFPVAFIKKYIDMMALHNMNRFHWHLTDDQGWRIESKKHPKLTEVGAIRSKTVLGRNSGEFDDTPYGGFYTQAQLKEVVKYAQERYITIIPEVDLPGHTLSVLAAYPEFGCTGGPYEVSPRWGIFDDVLCVGNERAMVFLEEILEEVIELFPSELIHIGGDEAPRTRWKSCPKCQVRIQQEGLKSDAKHTAEDRLQTYCMSRMEKFLNERGRRIIGWDEILEGDVAPNATVMSWRGMEGGIEAARLGHDVIMTPSPYVYFDYYQTDHTEDEPLSIGNYIPVEKVYSLEPVPEELNAQERTHIIGVQANLWTEYIPTTTQVEYMVLPRMAALAEVQWTAADKKNYADFTQRLPQLLSMYRHEGYIYATHIYDLKAAFTPQPEKRTVEVVLSTIDNAPIYYTLDGTAPTQQSLRYEGPITIAESVQFNAVAIRPIGKSRVVSETIHFNKATGCPITLKWEPSKKYRFNGGVTLVDGLKGNDSYPTGRWLGFIGGDMEATIDLQEQVEISRVSTQALVDMNAWIMGATGLAVYVSDDNADFREVASKEYPADTDYAKKSIDVYEVEFAPVATRYVKVVVKRSPALPKGHIGEGNTAYMFIDEIMVE